MVKQEWKAESPEFEVPKSGDYIKAMAQAGDNLLQVLNAQQDQALKIAQAVVQSLPRASDFNLPVVQAHGVEVPAPREVVQVTFDVADKFLANQKAYAERFLALTPA